MALMKDLVTNLWNQDNWMWGGSLLNVMNFRFMTENILWCYKESIFTTSALILFIHGFAIGFFAVTEFSNRQLAWSHLIFVMWLMTYLGTMVALVRKCLTEGMYYIPQLLTGNLSFVWFTSWQNCKP